MSCWRSSLARLHLFVTERTIHLHSMTVDFPIVTTNLMKHQLSSAVLQMGSEFQMWWRMWVMWYFLSTLYLKGEKCPHPIHRVLQCSLLGLLPRPYIFPEPGNGYLEGYWWSSCAGALLGLSSSPGEGKCQNHRCDQHLIF